MQLPQHPPFSAYIPQSRFLGRKHRAVNNTSGNHLPQRGLVGVRWARWRIAEGNKKKEGWKVTETDVLRSRKEVGSPRRKIYILCCGEIRRRQRR